MRQFLDENSTPVAPLVEQDFARSMIASDFSNPIAWIIFLGVVAAAGLCIWQFFIDASAASPNRPTGSTWAPTPSGGGGSSTS